MKRIRLTVINVHNTHLKITQMETDVLCAYL